MQAMLEAVLAGARDPDLTEVEVEVRPALAATASDVLAAHGFLLGTPANIGYMSGALKHFFDQVYYPTLLARTGAPFGLWVHGASDTTGAVRSVHQVASRAGLAAGARRRHGHRRGHPGRRGGVLLPRRHRGGARRGARRPELSP